ncbi:hypothetical protein [Massilia frigida]|uniref:hypothetical protein n=1 Tax=Massilia frigida TaxID=2609281 RepID=UPI001CB6F583|nr:hypothetical protein [Massilia frigida]
MCGSSARRDLCGGQEATPVPTATQFDLGSVGGAAFQAAGSRIHRLLFGDDSLAVPALEAVHA